MTQAEIFADIKRRRYECEEEGWTSVEYAENLGIADSSARRQVRDGVRKGTIRRVGQRPVPNEDGRVSWLPVYLFVHASPTKKADHRKETGKAPVARPVPPRRNGRN